MKKKINLLLYLVLIGFALASCKTKEHLQEQECIPYNKLDYNGFYDLGKKGKEFKLLSDSTEVYSVIKKGAILLNHIKKAKIVFDSYSNFPGINIELDQQGQIQFAVLSKKNIGKKIAVVFNNKLLTCPRVAEAIEKGKIHITSTLSLEETERLVAYINENCKK